MISITRRPLVVSSILFLCSFPLAAVFGNDLVNIEIRITLWDRFAGEGLDYDVDAEDDTATFSRKATNQKDIKLWSTNGAIPLELVPLTIPANGIRYSGSPNLVFFRETRLLEDGSEQPIPLGRYTIPANTKSMLLILRPERSQSTDSYQILGIPYDERQFPENSVQVFNISEKSLHVAVGKERASIENRGRHTFETGANVTRRARFMVAAHDGNRTRLLEALLLRMSKADSRKVIVLTPSQRKKNAIETVVFE